MDTNYIIETKNLTKQYGSQKSVADLNIHVKRGRIYGLLGRNGAGKTTTMKKYFGFLELMKKSLCLKQPEHIVIQLHSLKVETISALNVKISLEALN